MMNTTRTTPNPPANGDLIGNPPNIYNGDHQSEVQRFITQFGLFRIVNETNPVMTNPRRRIALALTYIRGPIVDNWVSQQFNALSRKVTGDEALWEDFIRAFKNKGWFDY